MEVECQCKEDLEVRRWEVIIHKWLVVLNKYRLFQVGILIDKCMVCSSLHLRCEGRMALLSIQMLLLTIRLITWVATATTIEVVDAEEEVLLEALAEDLVDENRVVALEVVEDTRTGMLTPETRVCKTVADVILLKTPQVKTLLQRTRSNSLRARKNHLLLSRLILSQDRIVEIQ